MPTPTTPTSSEIDHVDRFLAEFDGPALDLTVEGIVDRIEIHPAEIQITFSSSAPSEEMTKNQQNVRFGRN